MDNMDEHSEMYKKKLDTVARYFKSFAPDYEHNRFISKLLENFAKSNSHRYAIVEQLHFLIVETRKNENAIEMLQERVSQMTGRYRAPAKGSLRRPGYNGSGDNRSN